MPSKLKYWLTFAVLGLSLLVIYGLPRSVYKSPEILSSISIPSEMDHWKSRDVSAQLNLNDRRYNFIGGFVARQYVSDLGESLLFLVIDAINFHHPRGCFDSSGFLVHRLDDLSLKAAGKQWTAQAYFMEKGSASVVVVYWVCVDKKAVNWAEQRLQQLYYSLLGNKKAGFLLRLDIPARKERTDLALATAKDFIQSIGSGIPPEQAAYLFGEASP